MTQENQQQGPVREVVKGHGLAIGRQELQVINFIQRNLSSGRAQRTPSRDSRRRI
jgi:hypothetical protein